MYEFLDQHKFERRKERTTEDFKSREGQRNHPDEERRDWKIIKSNKEGASWLRGEHISKGVCGSRYKG